MLHVRLLTISLLVSVSLSNPIPTVSHETANAYLRSFLPWWPNNTDFSLTTPPTAPDTTNYTASLENLIGTNGKDENETSSADELDASMLRVQDIPSSPLDELRPDAAPKSLFSDSISQNDGNFIINFEEMGECPRDCSSDLREAMNIVLQDMSHVERYHRICEKYLNASACVSEDERCDKDDRGMFEMMTSGLHYMCVEQELAFNATIKCIDDEAGLVQSECDAQCQTKNLFMNWMMRTAMQDTIQQGVQGIVGAATGTNANPLAFLHGAEGAAGAAGGGWADMLASAGQRPPNPQDAQQGFENFRQFTNDLCRIGDCMLDCIRSKFNTRCEGSAGTLLSEVFVRPIAASQNKLSILRPILGSFMPEQCNYLHNNADLKKHRIDATMDEELKRMYAEKMAKELRDRNEQDELLSNLVPLDENGVPLPRALPELKSIDSPLDVSVKTLDQLILDMYSKNETKATKVSEKKNVTTAVSETEKYEKNVNSTTSTTTESTVVLSKIEETTANYVDDERMIGSGEGSGEEEVTTEMVVSSGDGDESSGEMIVESSGITEDDASGEEKETSGTESSGISQISDEILEESSGESMDLSHRNNENSGEEIVEGSTEEESSGSSGEEESSGSSGEEESSGDNETSGEESPTLTSLSDDKYIM